jgi:inosine-uridine nucleoside N-ribohydrolase
MKTIRTIAILAVFLLVLTCTTGQVSAGVELNNKGSLIRAVNQINVLQGQARGTLRTLESARSMLEDCERPDYEDLSDALDGFSEYLENLRDKVADFEGDPNFPKVLIGPLRELGDILQDIQTEADSFLSVNVD